MCLTLNTIADHGYISRNSIADSRVLKTLGPSLGISHHGFFEVGKTVPHQDAYFGQSHYLDAESLASELIFGSNEQVVSVVYDLRLQSCEAYRARQVFN